MGKLNYIKLVLQTLSYRYFKDDRGSQTIEYVAIGLLAVTIVGAIVSIIGGEGVMEGAAKAINETFEKWIKMLGEEAEEE